MANLRASVCGRTDVGLERDHNEDSFIVCDLEAGWRAGESDPSREVDVQGRGLLLAVCDGMGGAAAGEEASRLAVEELQEELSNGETLVATAAMAQKMMDAVLAANTRIWEAACAERSKSGMGTTASAAVLCNDTLIIAQVGDSRAYLQREGRLTQVTRDQSLAGALIESGTLDQAQAREFIHSNVILQALGVEPDVAPTVCTVELRRGDILLICSDGLSGPVTDEQLQEIIATHAGESLDKACEELIEAAKAEGAPDNVTAVLARFDGDALSAADGAKVTAVTLELELPPSVEASALDKATANLRAPTEEELLAHRSGRTTRAAGDAPHGHAHGGAAEHDLNRDLVIVGVLGTLGIALGALVTFVMGH